MPNSIEKKIRGYLKEYPTAGRNRVSKEFGISAGIAKRILRNIKGGVIMEQSNSKVLTGAIKADDFIAKYDVVQAVRDILPELNGLIILDMDLRNSLKVDSARWSRVRALEEFESYHMMVRGKVYWSTPETFDTLSRKMDIL